MESLGQDIRGMQQNSCPLLSSIFWNALRQHPKTGIAYRRRMDIQRFLQAEGIARDALGHSPRRRPDRARLRGWALRAAGAAARANQRAPKRGRLTNRDRTTRTLTLQRCQRSIGARRLQTHLTSSLCRPTSLFPHPSASPPPALQTRTMFVTRTASALARRTPTRAFAKRSFTSSIVRCT